LENRTYPDVLSAFLRFLVTYQDRDRLPSLREISQELRVSSALLREQLEVAKALGLVEVRPKTGIRRLPYSFKPAVLQSLTYAVNINTKAFEQFSIFRNHIEASYWFEAVALLLPEDVERLCGLIQQAEAKLANRPVQIPYIEHRDLHLGIYQRLKNPFVLGILEAYWETYEAIGLSLYADLEYLQVVWRYHRRMVDEIRRGDVVAGYQVMVEHADLLYQRDRSSARQKFE
jgi:DNA-binding FadR family transcriptional regulator